MKRVADPNLITVPIEPSYTAGLALEKAAGADRVLSLANGYLGYLETSTDVRAVKGESKKQYYAPELADELVKGAGMAGAAVRAR